MARQSNDELREELQKAKEELALIKQSQRQQTDLSGSLMEEMQKLNRQSSRVTTGGIPVKDIDDHVNIPLYTSLNKMIGPLHPANAKQTMERFYAAGYPLYTTKRTPEQIEAYKNSEIGKARAKQREIEYQRKKANSKQGRVESLAKVIAQETGKAVNNVYVSKND